MFAKSADISYNPYHLLESLPYLQESSYHMAMIPIMENTRLDANLIEVSNIIRYMNESGTSYDCFDDMVINIAESNNIYPESVVLVAEDSSIDLYMDMLEESVFYTVCKYNPNRQYGLMESDDNQSKGIRDSIADKLKKAKDWAQDIIDKIDKLSANKKGIFTKLKLYIVKFIRWITDKLESLIRPSSSTSTTNLKDIENKCFKQMNEIKQKWNNDHPTNGTTGVDLKPAMSFEEFDKTMSDPTKHFSL